ncbi:MAG: hypothetical protein HYY18_12670 [Planctomycetes bacterium]|nr:hypothetical protein [Planctomycetota bacterium]
MGETDAIGPEPHVPMVPPGAPPEPADLLVFARLGLPDLAAANPAGMTVNSISQSASAVMQRMLLTQQQGLASPTSPLLTMEGRGMSGQSLDVTLMSGSPDGLAAITSFESAGIGAYYDIPTPPPLPLPPGEAVSDRPWLPDDPRPPSKAGDGVRVKKEPCTPAELAEAQNLITLLGVPDWRTRDNAMKALAGLILRCPVTMRAILQAEVDRQKEFVEPDLEALSRLRWLLDRTDCRKYRRTMSDFLNQWVSDDGSIATNALGIPQFQQFLDFLYLMAAHPCWTIFKESDRDVLAGIMREIEDRLANGWSVRHLALPQSLLSARKIFGGR